MKFNFRTFLTFLVTAYLASKYYSRTITNNDIKGPVLFVTAHPDDECMFFTPTIEALKNTTELHILVLSNGGYDGLGLERTAEMTAAAQYMGFTSHKVVDDERIADGPWPWNATIVAEHVKTYMAKLADEKTYIQSIVTFDEFGVSSHPNHISVYEGCLLLSKNDEIANLYILESVNIVRKFIAFLDVFLTDTT